MMARKSKDAARTLKQWTEKRSKGVHRGSGHLRIPPRSGANRSRGRLRAPRGLRKHSGAPVRSIYRWKGKVEQAREFLLLIKTSRSAPNRLARPGHSSLHSYDVPEFIALPIVAGSPQYLAWLADSLSQRVQSS